MLHIAIRDLPDGVAASAVVYYGTSYVLVSPRSRLRDGGLAMLRAVVALAMRDRHEPTFMRVILERVPLTVVRGGRGLRGRAS